MSQNVNNSKIYVITLKLVYNREKARERESERASERDRERESEKERKCEQKFTYFVNSKYKISQYLP